MILRDMTQYAVQRMVPEWGKIQLVPTAPFLSDIALWLKACYECLDMPKTQSKAIFVILRDTYLCTGD